MIPIPKTGHVASGGAWVPVAPSPDRRGQNHDAGEVDLKGKGTDQVMSCLVPTA